MSAKSSTNPRPVLWRRALRSLSVVLLLTIWLIAATFIAIVAASGIFWVIDMLPGYSTLPENIQSIIEGTTIYALLFIVFVGVPWAMNPKGEWRKLLGIDRMLEWLDIGLSLSGLVLYFIFAGLALWVVSVWVPVVDIDQVQDVGITSPVGWELALAFVLLVIIAPIVEELIFRGYLYGALRNNGVSFIATTIVVSVLFGLAHGQWNVGINVAVMSVFMCIAREISGSIWPAVLMHIMKNGIAYYVLFGSPLGPGLQ